MKTKEQLGYLFNFDTKYPAKFCVELIFLRNPDGEEIIKRATFKGKEIKGPLAHLEMKQLRRLRELKEAWLEEPFLPRNGNSNNGPFALLNKLNTTDKVFLFYKYYFDRVKNLWPLLLKQEATYKLPPNKSLSFVNIQPISLGDTHPSLSFSVKADKKFLYVELNFSLDGKKVLVQKNEGKNYFFVLIDNKYYLLENAGHAIIWQFFATGKVKFPLQEKIKAFRDFIRPLQKEYPVEVDHSLVPEVRKEEPAPQLKVAEYLNQFLMIIPQFLYAGNLVDYEEEQEIWIQNKKESYLIERDKEKEKSFYESLRELHPNFQKQHLNPFFYLPFTDVMKGSWFLKTIRKLQDLNVVITGVQDLKKFRYNTGAPRWEMKTSSGTDWFDLKIVVTFGSQKVPLRDLQKAIKNRQKVVLLDDSSVGMLPGEWLDKYSMLMKIGEERNGVLRVNKALFTINFDFQNIVDNKAILKELNRKKELFQNVEELLLQPVSKQINATLRAYQLSGFNWMQTLDELNWGGCLADDMGLGKTLQTICFLQYVKEKYPKSPNLVVCPTSLIYNWESEFQKFAPSIKYHIYYGAYRTISEEHLENYDVILTSYGHMRNDINDLQKFAFQYVILDESQSIKNPDARVTKAAQLLIAKNRMILTGTPVQNNTFDLFAQMNFLNPGFLGNKEFFKNEFAIPIDRYGDAETAKKLRKMIYPFILRRTKEKVAPDLPDKTETILWCEMGKEQRRVYDEYKNYYKCQLLDKIDEAGIEKSAIFIIEGLLRLRQICDSPSMVNDPEVTTNESVKIEELLREFQENTGTHKVLVFSQFTQMLSLIKAEFEKQQINYVYLDGKTPASKRKDLVDQFQQDPAIKIFLISLKAGGLGLNLTAADYVYIVDPWWNPAAEAQAIDRTHRIGQSQKVFAYKMICKETVEEKILQLQQKKKNLSSELISEEKSFVKKLTREDVAFLFS